MILPSLDIIVVLWIDFHLIFVRLPTIFSVFVVDSRIRSRELRDVFRDDDFDHRSSLSYLYVNSLEDHRRLFEVISKSDRQQ